MANLPIPQGGGMRWIESVSGLCCDVLVTVEEMARNR